MARSLPGVLVVDDDPAIRSLLALTLDLEGYAVQTAGNGREALRVLAKWQPGVILLDLMMPEMDGWTFRAEQLHDEHLSQIPVVVISTLYDVRREAAKLAAAACLPKPCDLDVLLGTVSDVVAAA